MTKESYHHGDLRDALLKAAEDALNDMPIEAVSLREIARRAGVSHAGPKHHFASLGQLFGEVVARGFERFVESLQTATDQDADQSPHGRMLAMSRAYLRFAAAHPALYGLMFGKRDNVVQRTPHMTTSMIAAWSQLENQVAEVVGPSRAQTSAVAVWSMVHGCATLKFDQKLPPHVNIDAALETVVRTLVAGLEAEA
jgi:AcrR family transcriptional regulator